MMYYYLAIQFFEHFISSYYSINAVKVMTALGYSNQPIFAYSIPCLMMLAKFCATWQITRRPNTDLFFTHAINLLPIGTLIISTSFFFSMPIYSLATFLFGLVLVNLSLTWSDWYIHESLINDYNSPRFHQAAKLSNLSMLGIIVALAVSDFISPSIIYAYGSLIGLLLWLFNPHTYAAIQIKKVSLRFEPSLACHLGLSYTTFTIPFILFRYLLPDISHDSRIEHYADIYLMVIDMCLMYCAALWARKYFHKQHFILWPIMIGTTYFMTIILLSYMTHLTIILSKLTIILLGCYYNLIVTERIYMRRSSQHHIHCMEHWVGKTLFGKLWLPATIFLWQYKHSFILLALWTAFPAIITLLVTINSTKSTSELNA